MTLKNILILGVGNLLWGDEGLGIHVINQLQQISLPQNVELLDGGTTGFELMHYLHNRKKIIIVDAINGELEPGTILRLTPEDVDLRWHPPEAAHQFNLQQLLHFARNLVPLPEIVILGIVPGQTDRLTTWLSGSVQQQIPRLMMEIMQEINREPSLIRS